MTVGAEENAGNSSEEQTASTSLSHGIVTTATRYMASFNMMWTNIAQQTITQQTHQQGFRAFNFQSTPQPRTRPSRGSIVLGRQGLGLSPPQNRARSSLSSSLGAGPSPCGRSPAPLTLGMPDPDTIRKQKTAFVTMVDEQLKQAGHILQFQMDYQKQFLLTQVNQQMTHFIYGIDQQVQQQEMRLSQRYQEELMKMQAQVEARKSQLEIQAMERTLEYEEKRHKYLVMKQQYELQVEQYQQMVEQEQQAAQISAQTTLRKPELERPDITQFPTVAALRMTPDQLKTTVPLVHADLGASTRTILRPQDQL